MQFTPKSESELQQSLLLEAGLYPFQVMHAEDAISKSGNEMIKLTLKVWNKDGSERVIYDYLLEAMAFKLRHFCASAGLIGNYEAGNLKAADCIGKLGKVDIIMQSGQPNPMGGYYPDKNSVKDYLAPDKGSMTMPLAKKVVNGDFIDDDLPF